MRPMAISRLVAALVLIFIVCVTVLVLLPKPVQGSFDMEVAKALMQLGVVSVVGTVVSLLVFEYQRERQNSDKAREIDRKALEYREDLLKGVLARAMACYSRSKKARRLFRARGLVKHEFEHAVLVLVVPEEYDRCLDSLNDAQLELENIARDVLNSERAFSRAQTLVANLHLMDKYLSGLVTEYENRRGSTTLREGKLLLDELPELAALLLPASASPFKPNIIVPYHEVQRSIREDLLHPNLPARADA